MGICGICRGRGSKTIYTKCTTCNGTGSVNGHYCTGYRCQGGLVSREERCVHCNGTGKK